MEEDSVITTHDSAQAFIKQCLPGLKVKFYDVQDSRDDRRKGFHVVFEKLGMRTIQQSSIYSLPFKTLRFKEYLRELVKTVDEIYRRNLEQDG